MSTRYAVNKTKYLLDAEIEHLNQILTSAKDTHPRDSALLWFLMHTGARATEALNLMRKDLDPAQRTAFIKGIKGSDDREIPLPKWLFDMLIALPSGYRVFPISYSRLVVIWGHYRPVRKKLHSLRHTFAIRLYKKTRDLRLVQVALGHRNIANTMVYAQYIYSSEELRRLIL